MKGSRAMLEIMRNRTFGRLFAAQVVALVGTGLLTVALGLLAYDLAGSRAGAVLGTALTIKMVAYVAVAPVISALTDRVPRTVLLVGADVIRAVLAVLFPLVDQTWQVYVLIFVLQAASATFTPAFQSIIPAVLVNEDDYTRGLSLSRLAYDLESLLSPTIAAALLTVISYNNLFVGTAIGFALSATLVLASRLPARTDEESGLTFWQRLPLGVQVFARTKTLRFLLLTNVVVAAGTAIVLVNSVVYAKGLFGLDDAALAVTLACYGIGSLLVALNVPWIVERIGVVRTMMAGAAVITVGLVAAVIVTAVDTATGTGWAWLLATWVLLGMGTSLVNTPSSRLLADASTPTNRNLVYTAQFALSHACFLITYPIAGWIGAISLTAAAGVLLAIATVTAVAAIGYATTQRLRASSDQAAPAPAAPIDENTRS